MKSTRGLGLAAACAATIAACSGDRQHSSGGDPRPSAWVRRRVDNLVFPDTKPAYGSIKVDALGNTWVAEYSLGHNDRSGTSTVFDGDGRILGDVALPKDGRITEMGADYVMRVWRTELDVEQLKMYRLVKE